MLPLLPVQLEMHDIHNDKWGDIKQSNDNVTNFKIYL